MFESIELSIQKCRSIVNNPNPDIGELVNLTMNVVQQIDELREKALESGNRELLGAVRRLEKDLGSIQLPNTHWKREKETGDGFEL